MRGCREAEGHHPPGDGGAAPNLQAEQHQHQGPGAPGSLPILPTFRCPDGESVKPLAEHVCRLDLWVPLSVSTVVPSQSSPPHVGLCWAPLLGRGLDEKGGQRKRRSPHPCLVPECWATDPRRTSLLAEPGRKRESCDLGPAGQLQKQQLRGRCRMLMNKNKK